MFKYLIVLALCLAAVMAAPPAPEKDQATADTTYLSYGYPHVYSSYYPSTYSYSAYPYASYGYGHGWNGVYYGR